MAPVKFDSGARPSSVLAILYLLSSILCVCLAGCGGQATATPTPAPASARPIIIIEAEAESIYQPPLPDGFQTRTGAAGDVPATPAESSVAPPPGDSAPESPDKTSNVVESPVIYYYPQTDCPPCRNAEADHKEMADFRFIVAAPDAWSSSRKEGFPHFRWQVNGKWDGAYHGWYGPAAFRSAFELSLKPPSLNKTPAPARQPPAAVLYQTPNTKHQTSPGYPAHAGMIWNVEGDWHPSRAKMIRHLQTGQHMGKFSAAWLNSLSHQELVSLHDDDHNHHVRRPVQVMQSAPRATRRGTTSCPGGRCPHA